MTTIKYDFSIISNGSNDIFTNTFHEVSSATGDLLGVSIIFIVFSVLFTVFVKRTNDIGKSAISSIHVSVILSIILYYWGKTAGFVGIPDIILLILIIIDVGLLAFIKYNRQDQL